MMDFSSDNLIFSQAEPVAAPAEPERDPDALNAVEAAAFRTSLAAALPVRVRAPDRFFANLFDAYPEMEAAFAPFGGPPRTMFWATIGLLADNLDDLDSLRLPMRQLGARHARHGVTPDRYGRFADILIGTVAEIAGDDWDDTCQTAWEKVLDFAITQMQDGAAAAARSDPEDAR